MSKKLFAIALLACSTAHAEVDTDLTSAFKESIRNYDGSVTIVQPMAVYPEGSLQPIAMGSLLSEGKSLCAFFGLGEFRDAGGAGYTVERATWLGSYSGKASGVLAKTPIQWILCGPRREPESFRLDDRVEFGPPGSLSGDRTSWSGDATFVHPFVRGSGGEKFYLNAASSANGLCVSLGYDHSIDVEHEPAKNRWSAQIGSRGKLERFQAGAKPVIKQITCSPYRILD